MAEDKEKPRKEPPSDREARLAQALRENLRRRKAAGASRPRPKSDG